MGVKGCESGVKSCRFSVFDSGGGAEIGKKEAASPFKGVVVNPGLGIGRSHYPNSGSVWSSSLFVQLGRIYLKPALLATVHTDGPKTPWIDS